MYAFLDTLLTLSTVVVLVSFAWAMKAHFVTERVPAGAKVVSGVASIGFFATLHQLWTLEQPIWAQLSGLLAHAVSFGLFAWSISASRAARLTYVFDKDEPRILLRHGPYRFIRHPFYASYVLFWLGSALSTLSPLCAAFAVVLTTLFVTGALAEERKFGRSALRADYGAYRRQAGLFWPRLTRGG